MNYVKYYKKQTGKDFDSKKYSVHHIDGNRENNTIENLVMLPSKLHNRYHFLKQSVGDGNFKIAIEIISVCNGSSGYNDYTMNSIEKFIECWRECCKWNDYKHYLLGELPNIHKIIMEEHQ